MLDELVLHIGRHKSGTSSLQHFLAGRRRELDRCGILYPTAGGTNRIAHHALAQACNPKQSDDSAPTGIIRDLQQELAAHHHTMLVSSEAFQNITDLHRLNRVADALGAKRVRVICYVREHLDYAISAFRQMVQNQQRFMTFGSYAHRLQDLTPFIRRWQGFGDLTLKWYDRAELKNGDVIADFCELMNIEPGEIPTEDQNPSIGGNLLVYKLALNRLRLQGPGYVALRRLAADHAPFRAAFHVSEEDADALRKQSVYNASLFGFLGPARLKSWNDVAVLPQTKTLERDIDLIDPELEDNERTRLLSTMRNASPCFALSGY
jgi:hypothetical protein